WFSTVSQTLNWVPGVAPGQELLTIVTRRSALLGANVAVTVFAASIVTVQLAPLQAPLQDMKSEPATGVAVSVTVDPAVNDPAHVVGQLSPAGELVTDPDPTPARPIVSVKFGFTTMNDRARSGAAL